MDSSAHQVGRRWPRLWVATLGLAVVLAISTVFALWQLRRETLGNQARELELVSIALTDEVDRGLQGVREGLLAIRGELVDGQLQATGAGPALHTRAGLMPLVQILWILDANGQVVAASEESSAPTLASFLPLPAQLANDTMAVSRPFAVTPAGESMVALAMRLPGSTGTLGGWIVAALPGKTLLGAFSAASPAGDARLGVFRADGVLIAGSTVDAATPEDARVATRLATLRNIEVRQFRDGSSHLVGSRDVPHLGLKLLLTRGLADALSGWRETVRLVAAGFVILLLVMVFAVVLVQRADWRRSEAQHALELQMARASKLEALGTLAGGVAHDFNNVLAAILGFTEMARDAASQGSAQARHLDRALQAAQRGKALVERILAVSRGGASRSTVFELAPVVEEVLGMLAASLRPGVVLERDLGTGPAKVHGDPTQAFEAILNLCTNAMQAMPGGGMLSVHLARERLSEPQVMSHSRIAAGDYVVLTVSDQGEGISPAVMERLFEPFFTTRSAQSGTGLGLAVVHAVVTEFGGGIDVRSTPGKGARFSVHLPEATGPTGPVDTSPFPLSAGAGRAILVVDDEPELVALTTEMLTGLGYQPVGFHDPAAALQAVRDNPHRFAAMITDEIMPGLTGTQLAQAVTALAPRLPVLLVSGYGGTMLAARAAVAGVTRVLAKPLERANLARALAEMLV